MSRRDPWAWAGIAVVGLTAIVWSFAALSDLAHMVGVTAVIDTWWGWQIRIAWGLPITVDVLAVVATRVWLRGTAPPDAIAYACRAAWAAIVTSIVGNGYHGLLVGNFQFDALIVSAVPAVVIGAIVHLAVLVGRPPKKEPADEQPSAVVEQKTTDTAPAPEPPPMARPGLRVAPARVATPTVRAAVVDGDAERKARELAAAGVGRTRIKRETGVTDYVAQKILREAKAAREAVQA